jgi:hypothetical protein
MSFYYTTGSVHISNTTVSGNTAYDGGGGAYFYSEGESQAPVEIRNSTISNNTAGDWGGGLYIGGFLNTFSVFNSTISGNTAGDEGGGINFNGYYGLVLIQDTITNNTAATYGGLYIPGGGEVPAAAAKSAEHGEAKAHRAGKQRNEKAAASKAGKQKGPKAAATSRYADDGETKAVATIIAGNVGVDVGPASTVHSDHSLFGTVAAGTTIDDLGGTLIGANPNLGPLQNNGGPTQTHALLSGSAAIDTGLTVEPAFPGNQYDQRGPTFFRIENGVSDIGAYEVQVEEVIITPRLAG